MMMIIIMIIVTIMVIMKQWWSFALMFGWWSRCIGWISESVGVCSRRSLRSSLAQRRRVQRRCSTDATHYPWRCYYRFRTTPRCWESRLWPTVVIVFLAAVKVIGCLENQRMWWNLTAVREVSGNLPFKLGKCGGKISSGKHRFLLTLHLGLCRYLVASCMLVLYYTVKYDVMDNCNLGRHAEKSRANVREFHSLWRVVTLCIPMSLLAYRWLFLW